MTNEHLRQRLAEQQADIALDPDAGLLPDMGAAYRSVMDEPARLNGEVIAGGDQ